MAIYEYQCNACDSHFEIQQKMSDPREGMPQMRRGIDKTDLSRRLQAEIQKIFQTLGGSFNNASL